MSKSLLNQGLGKVELFSPELSPKWFLMAAAGAALLVGAFAVGNWATNKAKAAVAPATAGDGFNPFQFLGL